MQDPLTTQRGGAKESASGGIERSITQSQPRSANSARDRVAHAREIYHFSSLKEMVETADIVALGTVISTRPGRWTGEDSGAPIQFHEVHIKPSRILVGETQAAALVLEEDGYEDDGSPIYLNGSRWAKVEDEVIVFLARKRTAPSYGLLNSQARVFVQEDGTLEHNYHAGTPYGEDDPLVERLASMRRNELLEAIELYAGEA